MNRRPLLNTLIIILILCLGCRKELYDVPLPSEITKQQREAIGNFINNRIEDDQENYALIQQTEQLLPVYRLIQQLYDQVTNVMRLDNKSPSKNQWKEGRQWKVHLINSSHQKAFAVPGGDIYLSVGILKALRTESELYYVMATEAILMNEKYLLKELVKAYSTRTLVELAENQGSNDDRVNLIARALPDFNYELELSERIIGQVTSLICTSSIYNPLVGESLEKRLRKSDQWLSTRPVGSHNDQIDRCGDLDSKGYYRTDVLDRL